jgi:hypothetical protein
MPARARICFLKSRGDFPYCAQKSRLKLARLLKPEANAISDIHRVIPSSTRSAAAWLLT